MIVMLLCIEVGLRLPSLMAVVPPGLAVVNMVCTVYMMIERMVFVGLLGPPIYALALLPCVCAFCDGVICKVTVTRGCERQASPSIPYISIPAA